MAEKEPSLFQKIKADLAQANWPQMQTHFVWREMLPIQKFGFILLVFMFLGGFYFVVLDRYDRVLYLDATPAVTFTDGTLLLRTDPPGVWLIAPGDTFKSLEKGCRYKFWHLTFCGKRPCTPESVKHVRHIELVSCSRRLPAAD